MNAPRKQRFWAYHLLRPLARLAARVKFRYRHGGVAPLQKPSLILCNHVTDWDPILVASSFGEGLTFVASEHTMRWGAFSRLIVAVDHPIIRRKATVAAVTALQIARKIKAGGHVCLFAEGDRTFNGLTGPMVPATAALARALGAQLVTFRLEGGYLSSPRWARAPRRGEIYGHEIGRYPAEKLKVMTDAEAGALIARDLREDAYARQREHPVRYTGQRLAEGMETALFLCPRCGSLGSLRGEGNFVRCPCGLEAEYLPTGFLRGMEPPFDTVTGWDEWQRQRLRRQADTITFADENTTLYRIEESGRRAEAARGTLTMNRQGICVGGLRFPMAELSAVSVIGRCGLLFSAGDDYYEVKREGDYSAYKYRVFFELLKNA